MAWKFTKIDENSIMDKQKVLEISRMQKKEKKKNKKKEKKKKQSFGKLILPKERFLKGFICFFQKNFIRFFERNNRKNEVKNDTCMPLVNEDEINSK